MHPDTSFHQALLKAKAWDEFAAQPWPTRVLVISTVRELSLRALVERNGAPDLARQAVAELTGGSHRLAEIAHATVARWARTDGAPAST